MKKISVFHLGRFRLHPTMTNRSLARFGVFLIILLLKTFAAQATQIAPAPSALAPSSAKSNDKLRAAAEPFEKLTEISFSAAFPTIDLTIGEAEAAARGVRASLSKDAADQLAAQLSAMKSARQTHDRAGLALSSI